MESSVLLKGEEKNMKHSETVIDEIELDYTPFFNYIDRYGIRQYELVRDYKICPDMLFKLRHNRNITVAALGHIMKVLGTDNVGDVLKIIIRNQEKELNGRSR